METALQVTVINVPSTDATETQAAGVSGPVPAIAKTVFAEALRTWASGVNTPNYAAHELISLQSATEQIQTAVKYGHPFIDVPLLPHLAVLGMKRELEEFSFSIIGKTTLSEISPRSSRLLSRIVGSEELTIKIDEAKIKNPVLIKLLADLRQTLPELVFSIVAKINKEFELRCPLYHLRVALSVRETDRASPSLRTESVSAAAQNVLEEIAEEKKFLGLPLEASRIRVGAENFNRKALSRFIKDFDDNYLKAKNAGYNRLMAPLNRDNYEGCMEISGDTLFTGHRVTLSSIFNIFEPRGGGGRYCCHGSPPNFIWPVPETFMSPAIEEAKQFLIAKGLKPVFFRPSHWLTFGLTGEFPD